jgi:hypothetical protein
MKTFETLPLILALLIFLHSVKVKANFTFTAGNLVLWSEILDRLRETSHVYSSFEEVFDIPKHGGFVEFAPLKRYPLHVSWQYEHSLVLAQGAGVPPGSFHEGKIRSLLGDEEAYLVRYPSENDFVLYDIVVDYSMANVVNIASSGLYSEHFLRKLVYVPPLPYDYNPGNLEDIISMVSAGDDHSPPSIDYSSSQAGRSVNCLAMFTVNTYASGTRRALMLSEVAEKLEEVGVDITYVHSLYDLADIRDLLDESKIVLNIHQSDYHHTLEEFRVLPALLRGALVVSERVPLQEAVPYHEYVIFAGTSEFAGVVAHVSAHYEYYYDRVHGPNSGLGAILRAMRGKAQVEVSRALRWSVLCNESIGLFSDRWQPEKLLTSLEYDSLCADLIL